MRRSRSRLVACAALMAMVGLVPLASASATPSHPSHALHSGSPGSSGLSPRITKLWPHSAKAGQKIHLAGSQFSAAETVRVDGRLADFHVINTHKLVAIVPSGARTGRITVSAGRRTASSDTPLRVDRAAVGSATITFSPSSGAVGKSVTIFSTGQIAGSTCYITWGNNIQVPCSQGTVTNGTGSPCCQIVMPVPFDATSGPISLTDTSFAGTSTTSFRVTLGIALSDTQDNPGTTLTVTGSGFNANESVDLYDGTSLAGYASTDNGGNFSYPYLTVPTSAQPGGLPITAHGERSGLSTQTVFTVNTNWTERGLNPSSDRFNPYENTIGTSNVASLQRTWSYATGAAVYSSPAVVNGAATNGTVYVGSEDDKVYALNAVTGAVDWSYATGGTVYSSPAVANGVVYIGSQDKKVYALNATTGALIWSYATGGAIISSPSVVNGLVYVGSDDDKVYALSATSGAEVWTYSTGSAVESSPSVVNGVVYVGSNDDKVYALNAATGAEVWAYSTGGVVFSSPVVVNGVVYVGSADDKIYALNATTGGAYWSTPYTTSGPVYSSPTVANGVVYVGSDDGKIYALNAMTGALDWTYQTGDYVISSPALANGVLYVGSEDGSVYALNATTGAVDWSYATGSLITSAPAVVNGVLYIGSYDYNVYAFGLNS